jgi:hypothetical protein
VRGCAGVDVLQKVSGVRFVISGFVCRFVCHHASLFRTSLRDLCRRLLARLTSAPKFMYYENGYDESSRRGAPLRTVALHAMCNTVHRALINRYYIYTHSAYYVCSRLLYLYEYDAGFHAFSSTVVEDGKPGGRPKFPAAIFFVQKVLCRLRTASYLSSKGIHSHTIRRDKVHRVDIF